MNTSYSVSKELAERIVADIKSAANADANIMAEGGCIIASYDPARVGTYHDGAKRILAGELDEIEMTDERAASIKGARSGYIGVVKVDSQRVAVIAITGDPERAKPIQKMAELTLREEIRKETAIRKERELVQDMENQIMDIAERMMVLSLNGSIQAAKIGERGKSFKIVVAEMRRLAEQINDIISNISIRAQTRT